MYEVRTDRYVAGEAATEAEKKRKKKKENNKKKKILQLTETEGR